MDREVQWSPLWSIAWISSPRLPQLTLAEAQSKGRPRTSRGVDMQNSYVRWWGRGTPRLSGSSFCCGRRRENQPGSVTETNWRREELVLSTVLSVLNPGLAQTGCSSTSRQRPLALSVPCGTRFTNRTISTWQRSVVSDVGESPLFATWAPIQAWLWRFL